MSGMPIGKIEWNCPACLTPNVLITEDGGHYSLICKECGHPADILNDSVDFNIGFGTLSTCVQDGDYK